MCFSLQVKDVSLPNDEGITPLHNAVCAGHFDIVCFLVEFGADVNSADSDGWSDISHEFFYIVLSGFHWSYLYESLLHISYSICRPYISF